MNMQEIDDEIAKLEHSDSTWSNCEKLSILYGVKNGIIDKTTTEPNVKREKEQIAYSYASSEFTAAIQGKQVDALIDILEEHFEVVKLLFPKEYQAVIKKISEL